MSIAEPTAAPFRPARAYAALGDDDGAPFYDVATPATFPETRLRHRNQRWADAVGLGGLDDAAWIDHFARFRPLQGSLPAPLVMRYHGHQFRSYNPDIGDGRGFLFAQLFDDADRLLDLATKGSGQTPYSRFGDGRLTLKGGVREILATEMLEALGVYTSKSFSLVETGEALDRQDEPSPARSSVLVRLGHSHVRFGVFQRLAFEENPEAVAALVDYCVKWFDPDLADLPTEARTARFFRRVMERSARLVASWMAAGFVHGVLNTDNMNVTGESFDYGPWRFMPSVDPGFTAAYFDQTGLYAYARQPEAVAWNLSRLGGVLSPLTKQAALNEVLRTFSPTYERALLAAFSARLGVTPIGGEAGRTLVLALLRWIEATQAPFEQVMFDCAGGPARRAKRQSGPMRALYAEEGFSVVEQELTRLEPAASVDWAHAYFDRDGPHTMLIDDVEALWSPIAEDDDWRPFAAKLEAVAGMRRAYGFRPAMTGPESLAEGDAAAVGDA